MPSDYWNGQCRTNWTEEIQCSMPMVSTPRTWGKNYMFMWKTHQVQSRGDSTHWKSFRSSQDAFLSCISSQFDRLQAWISIVATASSQSKWCAVSLYKEEEQNLYECLGSMEKRFGSQKIPRSHWLERCVCTISRRHRTDWYLSRSACWATRQI